MKKILIMVGLLFCVQAGFARVSYQEASAVDVSSNSVEAVTVKAITALHLSDKEAVFALCSGAGIEEMKKADNYMIDQAIKRISSYDLETEFRLGIAHVSEDKKSYRVAIKVHDPSSGRTRNFNIAIENIDGEYKVSKML